MNKLEEKYLKEIRDVLHNKDNKTLAKSCAAITKDVAVKFAEWNNKHYLQWTNAYVLKSDYDFTNYPKECAMTDLFDYFIENVYGK